MAASRDKEIALDLYLRLCRLQSGAHAQPGRGRFDGVSSGSSIGVLLWLSASLGFRAYLHFFNS